MASVLFLFLWEQTCGFKGEFGARFSNWLCCKLFRNFACQWLEYHRSVESKHNFQLDVPVDHVVICWGILLINVTMTQIPFPSLWQKVEGGSVEEALPPAAQHPWLRPPAGPGGPAAGVWGPLPDQPGSSLPQGGGQGAGQCAGHGHQTVLGGTGCSLAAQHGVRAMLPKLCRSALNVPMALWVLGQV